MEDTRTHALDYVSLLRRRRWWLVGPMLASVVIGLALVRFLPKEYRSSTTLGVSAPSVSPNLVNQVPSLDNEERFRAITQQLMSPQILARVAQEEGLASRTRGGSTDATVSRLHQSIQVSVPEPVAPTEQRRFDAFIVSYSDSDPGRAQRVANRIARIFVDENSKVRAIRAEDTSAFLATNLRASEQRLAQFENRLRLAKEAHMGQLPEQTQANLQTLSGLRQQLEANAMALRGEQDRLSMIERQIDSIRRGSTDVLIGLRPGQGVIESGLPPATRVFTLERELAAARLTYTDRHPEVIRLQQELATARKETADQKQKPESDRLAILELDPAYRQQAADREMSRLRIRDLQRAEHDIRSGIAAYQARVEKAPMVEQQLATVQRDYDLEKQQYMDLSAKLRAASIAENVERNRRSEQFTILYAASFPTEPVKPVPVRVMLMSILAGACVGGGLMLMREYFDRSIHDARQLRDEIELPVLGEIARIELA